MPLRRLLIACAALLLVAAAPAKPRPGTQVLLRPQPGSPLDQIARRLAADDLAAARSRGDKPNVLIGTAKLGGDRPALFVQLQSAKECGSAGCTTTVYAFERGGWRKILDGTTGRLTVSPRRTDGWPDLLTDDERYVWAGSAYRSTTPAPALNLRRPAPRHSSR